MFRMQVLHFICLWLVSDTEFPVSISNNNTVKLSTLYHIKLKNDFTRKGKKRKNIKEWGLIDIVKSVVFYLS